MNLAHRVKATIEKYRLLEPGDGVLVGVSGGPDSMALFHLLYDLNKESGWRLAVAHLGHGIRGEQAKRDAQFVARIAKESGVPFYLKEVDLAQIARSGGVTNLEGLGRRERYEFFNRVARAMGYNKVATGHTQDDQAETMLMWLVRGSGRKGMGGMPPKRPLSGGSWEKSAPLLVRPLIDVGRDDITAYLAAENLDFRVDDTNFDCRYLRNWIRHRLLPPLRRKVGRGLTKRLARLADIWRDEDKVLEEVVQARLRCVAAGSDLVREGLLQEGSAMQRRLVRSWIEAQTGSLRRVGFEDIDRALAFIRQGPAQGRISLPGGWALCREYDRVRLRLETTRGQKTASVRYEYTLPLGGRIAIHEAGVELQSLRIACAVDAPGPRGDLDHVEAIFDCGALPERLTVRNFLPGDRFQPLGMQGHKKLKDLFIEKKVPLAVRRTLPLVLAGERIVWIPSYGRSEFARTGPETREFLIVRLTALHGSG